ncbi:MAG TPA: histidine phosphatase family protein, partial [Polyangia bacterium]
MTACNPSPGPAPTSRFSARGRHLRFSAIAAVLLAAALLVSIPLGLAGPTAPGTETTRPTTIVLVRHAEKAGEVGDVPLSAAGKARAVRLAHLLADANVRHIFTSGMIRTRETAAPLAQKLGLTPQPMAQLAGLVKTLQALPAGAVALVVHHSNTVPQIADALGATKVPPIAET